MGEPDKYCDNPHWRGGPDASLYSIERVETWVQTWTEVERKVAGLDRKEAKPLWDLVFLSVPRSASCSPTSRDGARRFR